MAGKGLAGERGVYYGEQIRNMRIQRGLTQWEFAQRIGLTRGASTEISRWENNRMPLHRTSLKKIADAFGVSEYEIFPEVFRRAPMTLNEYQQAAQRTMNNALNFEETSRHALHGMAAEVGEIHGLYQKFYQGHEMDAEHVMKEVGDLLWMIAEFCTVHGWSLGDVAQKNIDKLLARYPEGFNVEQSLNRKEGDV